MCVSGGERPLAWFYPACGDRTGNVQCQSHGRTCSHPVPQCVAADCMQQQSFRVCDVGGLQSSVMFRSVSGWFVVDVSGHLLPTFNGQCVRKERNFFVYILTLDDDTDGVSRNIGNAQAWRTWPLKIGPILCPETSVMNEHGDFDP
jgi:hypothetical protein